MRASVRILCGILGFFLALSLLGVQLLISLQTYFLKSDTFSSRLCEEQTVVQVQEYLLYECESVADACGLPYAVFDGAFSTELLSQEIRRIIDHLFRQETYQPDTAELSERLTVTVLQTLASMEDAGELSAYEQDVRSFCKQVCEIYTNTLNLKVYPYVVRVIAAIKAYLPYAWAVLLSVSPVALYCMWLLVRSFGMLLRELSFSVCAAGGFLALSAVVTERSGLLSGLRISPPFFSAFLQSYINGGLHTLLLVGCVCVGIGILLFLLSLLPLHGKPADPNPTL